MAGPTLSIDAYRALKGTEVALSKWIDIPQDRIDAFASATLDRQFIHVDPVAAKRSAFGTTIAHGFLTLSLLTAMMCDALPTVDGAKMIVNYGVNKLRFISVVRSGKRVRGRFVLKSLNERSTDRMQLTLEVNVEIEGESKPALVAEWLSLIYL